MRDTSLLNSGLLFELSWWHQRFGPVWGSALYTTCGACWRTHLLGCLPFHWSGLFTPSRAFAAFECHCPGRMTGSSVPHSRGHIWCGSCSLLGPLRGAWNFYAQANLSRKRSQTLCPAPGAGWASSSWKSSSERNLRGARFILINFEPLTFTGL